MLNPKKLEPFKDSYEDRMRMQQNLTNSNMWIQGLYIRSAIGSVLGGSKYEEEPFEFANGDKKSVEKVEEKQDGMCNDAMNFMMFASVYNNKFKN